MIPLSNDIICFLEDFKEEFLSSWIKDVIISEEDPLKEAILQNGEVMYDLVVKTLTYPFEKLEKLLIPFAQKVADERIRANVNIGEFVYNVNFGRTIIYQNLFKLYSDWDELQPAIDKINYAFDKFLYFAVSYYTDVKNQIIEEKNEYITSTHHDRLTLLGQMTSSFVHEFRNPLTSIHGFVQLLRSEHPSLPYLDIISNELDQLKFSISQFLMLSKKEVIEDNKTSFSLNDLIEQVLSFLYPRILEVNVEIKKNYQNEFVIHGFKDAIRQVLINIVFNAVDVLSHIEEPVIQIKLDEQKDYIRLDIANNGPKIPDSLLDNIFEPFVTTKKAGTGLGLYVSKNTIEKHGGTLTCESNEDWTIFTIILPN